MNNLQVIKFDNQRIMTTKVLAESYGTEEKNIQINFSRNTERFTIGKHYYKLEGEELKQFKESLPTESREPLKFAPQLILWTEKGAARHAKILDTDEAWEVYELLEETYFRFKENQSPKPTCIEDILIQSLQEMKDIKQQVNELGTTALSAKAESTAVKVELQDIRDVITLSPISWRKDTVILINKIALTLGGYEHIKVVREGSYKLLEERMGVSLAIRLTNKRRRMADEGVCKSKRDKLSKVDIIAEDKKLIEGFVAIVKEMAIKNKVA